MEPAPIVCASAYRATLERGSDGTYLAWVDELPGCAVRAGTRVEVVERLPKEIRSFLAWAGADTIPNRIDVEISDEVDSPVETDEDTEVLLAVDRQPLTAREWHRIRQLLERSRSELRSLLERLSSDELRANRAGSERSVREEIEHIAFVEFLYAAWTFDLQSKKGLHEFLAWTRDVTSERMQGLAAEDDAELTWAYWGGAPRPEEWTARKAARRLLWHELLHLRAIQRFVERDSDGA